MIFTLATPGLDFSFPPCIVCTYRLQLSFAIIVCNYRLQSSFAIIVCNYRLQLSIDVVQRARAASKLLDRRRESTIANMVGHCLRNTYLPATSSTHIIFVAPSHHRCLTITHQPIVVSLPPI
jgi:hypothetical protein